jgi:fatty acid desaturase
LGLLKKQPGFLASRILTNLVLLMLSLAVLFLSDNILLQLGNAVFMAFVFGQIGFIAHDTGHRQAYNSPATNDLVGMLHANLLLGMSLGWWVRKHNRHHANPNHSDLDPDIGIVIMAFTEQDALAKRGFYRFMVRYQAFFFFPLLLFEGLSLRIGSLIFVLQHRFRHRALEITLIVLNLVWFGGVIFLTLGPVKGLIFLIIQQALFGFYMGSVFAPNHKGMPVIGQKEELDFLRLQVLTARNIDPHPLTDYFYGGLNYQIEHHLFPGLARNRLKQAREVVLGFCQEGSIPYHSTSVLRSYYEILGAYHRVSAPLRRRSEATNNLTPE